MGHDNELQMAQFVHHPDAELQLPKPGAECSVSSLLQELRGSVIWPNAGAYLQSGARGMGTQESYLLLLHIVE